MTKNQHHPTSHKGRGFSNYERYRRRVSECRSKRETHKEKVNYSRHGRSGSEPWEQETDKPDYRVRERLLPLLWSPVKMPVVNWVL